MKIRRAHFLVILFLIVFQNTAVSAYADERSTGNEFSFLQDTLTGRSAELDSILVDSILKAERQAQKIKYLRFLAEGKIPVWYFNINYNSFLHYNLYEGIKIGVGAETNRRLSEFFSAGGYITYGLKEKSVRHGVWLDIFPNGYYDFRIYLGYRDMNVEFGGSEFLEKKTLLNPEYYRNLLIQNMYSTKRYTAGIELRPIRQLNTYLFADLSDNSARKINDFLFRHSFDPFRLARMGLQLRYSPGIEFVRDPDILIEKTDPKTDWFLSLVQGTDYFQGEYTYTKMEFKGRFQFHFSQKSNTKLMLRGGYIADQAPLTELFNGYGSYVNIISFAAPFSFTTMRQNEFASDRYSSIHIRHEFGQELFPAYSWFRPSFVLAQNMGFGILEDKSSIEFGMNDFRKGYYESGLEINNLLHMDFLSWGTGLYYRYGSYRLDGFIDNLALKFGFYIKL